MKMKLNLEMYKDQKTIIEYYEILMGKGKIKQLEDAEINPSTYWKVKNDKSNMANDIILKLNKYFKHKKISEESFYKTSENINSIYTNIYYRNDEYFENNLLWLENKIKTPTILDPIYKLLYLLIKITTDVPRKVIEENKDIYEGLKKFEKYYKEDLYELFLIIKVSFEKDIDEYYKTCFNNPLMLHTMSTKALLDRNYGWGLYYADSSLNYFLRENNFKRIDIMMLNKMHCHNALKEYDKSYDISTRMMSRIQKTDKVYELCRLHRLTALLGAGKYEHILKDLNGESYFNNNDFFIYIICCYKIKMNYIFLENNETKTQLVEDMKEILLNDNVKLINTLNSKYNISNNLIIVLEEIKLK